MTLSVGDGFKFGCGLILALVAFNFIVIMFVTGISLMAMLLNFPMPSILGQPLKFLLGN